MKPKLTIYYTSDTHGYVFPTNYIDDAVRPMGLTGMIHQFAKDGNTLVLDGGDTLQGSPLTYYCHTKGLPSPMPLVMNEAGYDAVTLGNHDFNYGYDALSDYLSALHARCLCANVRDRSGRLPISPYQIQVMENGLRVGILGIVTPWVNRWEQPETLSHFEITDPLEAAKAALEALHGQTDFTICIYHGGLERDPLTGKVHTETDENIACRLCEELDFDLMLTGHQHVALEGVKYHGTYLVQPPANATHYLKIEVAEDGHIASRLLPSDTACEKGLKKALQPLKEDIDTWLDMPIGRLKKPLWPEGKVHMALYGTPIASFFNQVQLEASGADISCTSLANEIRGFDDRVTVRDVVSTYVYPNTLVVLQADEAILREALERCASYFEVSKNGQVSVAKDFLQPKVAHYNYDFFSGIRYEFDLEKPVGKRLASLLFHGKPVEKGQSFTLCMNNYRATGVAGYDMYLRCPKVKEIQREMSELILDYFTRHDMVSVEEPDFQVTGWVSIAKEWE